MCGAGNWYGNNPCLTDITALENLTSIAGGLSVRGNDSLTILEGLNNIQGNSIQSLEIAYNPLLSSCAVKSICDYLGTTGGDVLIEHNALGCGNVEEVDSACLYVSTHNLPHKMPFKIHPNPFSTSTTIEYELNQPTSRYAETVTITFYNQFGKLVDIIKAYQKKGFNRIEWAPEQLADGIYYFRFEAGEQITSGKMVLMR
jgi:hypothetical protein